MFVEAFEVDSIHFKYNCPICSKVHQHGSCNELHNRIEFRGSHCLKNKENIEIHITDNTKRSGNTIINTIKKKYLHRLNGNSDTRREEDNLQEGLTP
jgi:hypothetical protein